jgi:ankyrin repeat protein
MSPAQLPERPSLEFLKKSARQRLQALRRDDPGARLSDALLAVAREYGYPSWRALKVEVGQHRLADRSAFSAACRVGDLAAARRLLDLDPSLVGESSPDAAHGGWTGLHAAAQGGHAAVVDLLLARGADVNAREAGDNTTALHWAAARADLAIVRALLDAGADVAGIGDVHQLDVIGWAAFFRAPGTADATVMDEARRACIDLLVERGARHHIFSAICVGDHGLIRSVVEDDPDAADRRMSRFERGMTALHFAIARHRYDILDLLIQLGVDVEMTDDRGQTALTMAMLQNDREAIARLRAAGAANPEARIPPNIEASLAALGGSVTKGVPMIAVADVGHTLAWYVSLGFREVARYGDNGIVNFGMVALGGAQLMLTTGGGVGRHGASLWFYTDAVDDLYAILRARQLAAASEEGTAEKDIVFTQDIEDMFYGARQFCIRDPNGYELYFIKET